jgi:hypothetical protein
VVLGRLDEVAMPMCCRANNWTLGYTHLQAMPGNRASASSRSTPPLAAKQQLGHIGRLENYSALLGHKGLMFCFSLLISFYSLGFASLSL